MGWGVSRALWIQMRLLQVLKCFVKLWEKFEGCFALVTAFAPLQASMQLMIPILYILERRTDREIEDLVVDNEVRRNCLGEVAHVAI